MYARSFFKFFLLSIVVAIVVGLLHWLAGMIAFALLLAGSIGAARDEVNRFYEEEILRGLQRQIDDVRRHLS